MGVSDFIDGLGDGAENLLQGAEHVVGGAVDQTSHLVGDGLNAIGLHGAARAVDNAGDSAADFLGAQVAEQQLGQTNDPTQLVHGDVGKINDTVGHLQKFATAFEETADGLHRVDTAHWSGQAAEAFRAKFQGHPQQWDDAQQACTQAASALVDYAQAVKAAQDQARQAIDLYNQGKQQSQQARDAYNNQVNTYNSQLQAYQAGGGAGAPPQRPGEFHDPGEQSMKDAQGILDRARQQRNAAAGRVASALQGATNLAPAEPKFTERMLDQAGDAIKGTPTGLEHIVGGVLKGAGDIVKFARSVNPLDPYNETHPAEYVAGLSGTAAGLLHAANHPTELIQGIVGTGWGSDPFEAFGKLIPNVVLAAATDGGGTAADAGTGVAEGVAEREGVSVGEEAGTGAGEGARPENPEDTRQPADGRCGCGEPVDIASGEMFMTQHDVDLPGALPLRLSRTHVSSYRAGRFYGPSWSSTMDQRLEIDEHGVVFVAEDGVLLVYPIPAVGASVLPATGARWPLSRTEDGYTLTDPKQGITRRFAAVEGTLLPLGSIHDRNGNHIDFAYDDAGMPREITHSGGYRIRVDSTGGLITGLSLCGNGEGDEVPLMQYGYHDRRLSQVVNDSGLPLRFDYDAAGRITGWTDRNGVTFRYIYDHRGRCIRTDGPDGFMDGSFDYEDEGHVHRYTNSLGHVTTFYLNERKQVIREIDPLGGETRSEWDDFDRLVSRTDPLGRTTRYEYDDDGNLIAATRPDGSQTRFEYNDLRLPITIIAPDGTINRREYDEHGNLTAVTDPLGTVTRYSYDDHGHLRETTDALGHVRQVDTNAAGLPVMVTNALGATTRYERDAFGRVTAITDPAGSVTRFGWTMDGKPSWRALPDGATERWTYDGEGNVREHTDALGQATHTEVTLFDLPSAEVRPDGSRLEYAYDTELRLSAVTNEQGLVWRYDYDPAGNLVRETDFNGRVVSYRHDAAGQLVERVNGLGETTYFVHDVLGNVIERRSGQTTATFTYDELGRLVEAMDDDTQVHFHRDSLGRVLTETINGHSVASVYDPLGRRLRRRTPSGAESVWEYDAEDHPKALHTAGRTVRFDYDPAGREIQRAIGANTALAQTWDSNHRLLSQTVTSSGRRLQHRSYTYRPDGFLTGIDDHLTGPRIFDLDVVGRVTAVRGPKWTERYAYDAAGNVTTAAWPGPAGPPDADLVGDREYTGTLIHRAGNVRYEHDAQGRVVLRQQKRLSKKPATWRYFWDADDRLTEVLTPDGALWRYRYDPLGRRVAKQRLTPDGHAVQEEILFTWDGNVLAEQAHLHHNPAAGDPRVTVWDYEPGTFRPVTQHDRAPLRHAPQQWVDEQFYAIVTDLIGTPTELMDDQGDIAWHHHATLWGHTVAQSSAGVYTPLRFPGQYADPETGFHYNYHRHYDPTTGRYSSSDPLGLAPSPNPNTYVRNPTSWVDPLGLMGEDCSPTKSPWIAPGSLPADEDSALNATLQHIDDGTVPTDATNVKWGQQFKNWNGDLPGAQGAASPYREYRVAPPPGTPGAGPLRVVVNSQTGETYYTWTHYGDTGNPAFVRIR